MRLVGRSLAVQGRGFRPFSPAAEHRQPHLPRPLPAGRRPPRARCTGCPWAPIGWGNGAVVLWAPAARSRHLMGSPHRLRYGVALAAVQLMQCAPAAAALAAAAERRQQQMSHLGGLVGEHNLVRQARQALLPAGGAALLGAQRRVEDDDHHEQPRDLQGGGRGGTRRITARQAGGQRGTAGAEAKRPCSRCRLQRPPARKPSPRRPGARLADDGVRAQQAAGVRVLRLHKPHTLRHQVQHVPVELNMGKADCTGGAGEGSAAGSTSSGGEGLGAAAGPAAQHVPRALHPPSLAWLTQAARGRAYSQE